MNYSHKSSVLGLVILLSISLNSLGQPIDFLEGYIIKANNDTIYGLIRNENSISNQKDCFFKEDGSEQIVLYNPKDLNGYQIINRNEYLSKLITVNKFSTQQVFIERIVTGKINLYRYFTEVGRRYFIEKENEGRFLELIENKNSFRGLLNYTLSDCKYANTDVFKLPYKESAFIERISQYNNCDNPIDIGDFQLPTSIPNNQFERPRPTRVISFGPIIGGGLDQISISTNNINFVHLDKTNFKSYQSLNFGFFSKISVPSLNNKVGLTLELLYGFRKFKGDYEVLIPPNITNRNFALLEMHSLMVPIIVDYMPLSSKLAPIFEIGISPRFAFDEVNTNILEEEVDNTVLVNQSEVFKFRPMEIAVSFGIGASLSISEKKKMGLKLRYLLGNGLDNEPGSNLSNTSNLQILLSYHFIK